MLLIYHDSEDAARESARILRSLGTPARRILEECVEHQEITRTRVSAALQALDNAGFVFVRELEPVFSTKVTVRPSLAGEEALEMLDLLDGTDHVGN